MTGPTPAPYISHYATSMSLTARALAKRSPLRYGDIPQIRAMLEKPTWSVRRNLLPPSSLSSSRAEPHASKGISAAELGQRQEQRRRQRQQQTQRQTQLEGQAHQIPTSTSRTSTAEIRGAEPELELEVKEEKDGDNDNDNDVSVTTLHHLLRLSALPPPESSSEERKMLHDLRSQIHFVRQMQRIDVDVDGVEPLVAIRDESDQAVNEARIGLDNEEIRSVLAAEELIGAGTEFERTRRRRRTPTEDEQQQQCQGQGQGQGQNQNQNQMDWDPFDLMVDDTGTSSTTVFDTSQRKAGRWFVVKKREKGQERQKSSDQE